VNSFEAFKTYRSLKLHFTNDKYDFFKYHGKTRTTVQQFEKSRDKMWYGKVAKNTSPVDLIVSNFAYRDVNWVGELFDQEGSDSFTEMQKRHQSITYLFKNDLDKIDDLISACKVTNGQTPLLLTLFRRGTIMLETLCILDDLLKVCDYWDQKIGDTILWPTIRRKIKKYAPFIDYDSSKFI